MNRVLRIFFWCGLMTSGPAFAGPCKDANNAVNAESGQIAVRQKRINELNALNAQWQKVIDDSNLSMPGFKVSIAVCDQRASTVVHAAEAVNQAVALLEGTLVVDRVFEKVMAKIVKSLDGSGEDLSAGIRRYIESKKIKKSSQEIMEKMAQALEILEQRDQAWKASQRQILAEYLEGRLNLGAEVLQRLNLLRQELELDINTENQTCKGASDELNTLTNRVNEAQTQIGHGQVEIAKLTAEIQAAQARIAAIDRDRVCEREALWNRIELRRYDKLPK